MRDWSALFGWAVVLLAVIYFGGSVILRGGLG